MKNRRNIVEQKYPPENPNDIWLKDGKFYRSTSEGWIVIDSETEYTNKEAMNADKPKGGTIGVDKETGEASIYNDVVKQWSPLGGGGGMTETTWQELKDLRDNSQLTPGSLYRITDYQCTTTQENTQSAGHQFDIVLLALSENKLAEEGWAMMNDNVYTVTDGDGVTKKCWIYSYFNEYWFYNIVICDTLLGEGVTASEIHIDEDTKSAIVDYSFDDFIRNNLTYNYFQNSNLSAWKVWYCLDNDTTKFAWADDGVDEDSPASIQTDSDETFERYPQEDTDMFAWYHDRDGEDWVKYTEKEIPDIDDELFNSDHSSYKTVVTSYTPAHEGTGLPNGRGVIYRLIDEWNNDVAYDFKNIQFVRPMTDGFYDAQGIDTWVYSFSYVADEVIQDGSLNQNIDNTISSIKVSNGYKLNNIVSIDNSYGHVSNSFINCQNVTVSDDVENAQFIHCYNFQMNDTNGAIFINNKKVLTES